MAQEGGTAMKILTLIFCALLTFARSSIKSVSTFCNIILVQIRMVLMMAALPLQGIEQEHQGTWVDPLVPTVCSQLVVC